MKAVKIILFFFAMAIFQQYTYAQKEQKGNFFEITEKKRLEFDERFKERKNLNEKDQKKLDKEYKKHLRWLWYWETRIDAEGNFGSYGKEYFKRENISELKNSPQAARNINSNWSIIGPEAFPTGTDPSGIKGIGRIDAIVVDPNNSNHVIVGARAGGIWESYNIHQTNVTWNCLTNDLPVGTVNDLKIVNNTLYASVSNMHQRLIWQGEQLYGLGVIKKKLNENDWYIPKERFESLNMAISTSDTNIIYSVGRKNIYKSVDGGDTWEALSDPFLNFGESKLYLGHIEVNPLNSNIAVVSGRLDRYASTNVLNNNTLVFKTTDGGKSWVNLTDTIESVINTVITNANTLDDLIDFDTLFNLDPGGNGDNTTSAFTSYNYNGTLYLALRTKRSPTSIATDHRYSLYFVKADGNWDNFQSFNTLGNDSWLGYPLYLDNQTTVFQVVNADKIIVGNRQLRIINNSTHSASTLDGFYNDLHQDIRSLNYDANLGRLLVGTDGSIHKAFDSNNDLNFTSFPNLSGNLNLFLAYNMGYTNIGGTQTVRIGTQDTGWYENFNLGSSWTGWNRLNPFGEGMIFSDPTNSSIIYLNDRRWIEKSINGGANASYTGIRTGSYQSGGGEAFQVSPNNSNHIILDKDRGSNYYSLRLSNNQLASTVDISNGIHDLDIGRNLAVEISKANSSVFYIARRKFGFAANGINNTIYKSTNLNFSNPSSITYTNLTANLNSFDSEILGKAYINDIEVDDTNENKVWLGFGNLEEGKKIYQSLDGGITWLNISSNLPNVPVNTVQYDAVNNVLYAGTDYGVYYYNNTSELWARYGVGLPVAIVTTIAIDNTANEIIASTHGRSVWTAPINNSCGNTIVTTSQTWTTDHDICGDLIIKDGGFITLSNARIKANNIIIEGGSRLISLGGELTSNHHNTSSTNLKTDIMLEHKASLTLSNSVVNGFNMNVKDGANIFLNGNGPFTGNINLNQSEINVFNNGTYNQVSNANVVLNDLESTINFYDDFLFGSSIYVNKIDAINFSGLGSLNVINSSNIYVQNESLTNGNKYRFDSDTSITTGNDVNPNPTPTGSFDTNNADVILKAKQSITLDPGTIIETDSFIAFIDSEDVSNYDRNTQQDEVIIQGDNVKGASKGLSLVESISVYPNPTRQNLNIKLKDNSLAGAKMVIRDIRGNILLQTILDKDHIKLDIENYKKGVYLFHFIKDEKIVLKRIIKL